RPRCPPVEDGRDASRMARSLGGGDPPELDLADVEHRIGIECQSWEWHSTRSQAFTSLLDAWSRAGLGLLRQAEHALAHDVALDLAGAAPDRLAAAEEERAHHRADRVAVA